MKTKKHLSKISKIFLKLRKFDMRSLVRLYVFILNSNILIRHNYFSFYDYCDPNRCSRSLVARSSSGTGPTPTSSSPTRRRRGENPRTKLRSRRGCAGSTRIIPTGAPGNLRTARSNTSARLHVRGIPVIRIPWKWKREVFDCFGGFDGLEVVFEQV